LGAIPPNLNLIDLCHLSTGVHHAVGKVSVIGEKEQTLGIAIQSSDGINPTATIHQGGYGGSALLVGKGGHIASGLMKHQIYGSLLCGKRLAVNEDAVCSRLCKITDHCRLTVEADTAFPNPFLGSSP
jgi:hypothetical protein